jgi:antagonist of KipI
LRPILATTVRLIAGEHQVLLDDESRGALFGDALRVSPRSDRMGYRLAGATLQLREPIELLSAGVTSGTLQLPPGGEPILLMADHQTTGGYPVLGHVASVDLGAVAQLRPGDSIRFSEISLDDAQRLYLERERSLDALRRALSYPA